MKEKIVQIMMIVSPLLAQAQSPNVSVTGDSAQKLYVNLNLYPSHENGILALRGFVTEKSSPLIEFTNFSFLSHGIGEGLPLDQDKAMTLYEVMTNAGISPINDGGGTTYLWLQVQISCSVSHDIYNCNVQDVSSL